MLKRTAAVLLSILIGLAMCELALAMFERAPGAAAPATAVAMPPEWQRRDVTVPGAKTAYYWQGKLHVHNEERMRIAGEYQLEPDAFRIVVLGDSLTYGYGIAAEDTYSSLLQARLSKSRPTRVYNLGVSGQQSEDILHIAQRWLPRLKPQLVLYGICLNDFLPSGTGQYANNMRFAIPVPTAVATFFETKTRVGSVMANGYNRLLIAAGIRNDFFDDILHNFGGYQTRFKADLTRLNALARETTGVPVVAMVLDQYPDEDRGREIALLAEAAAREAGMTVVPIDAYYAKFRGTKVQLHVSPWEGHPNEVANAFYAERFAGAIESRPPFTQP